jgi:hypothetical protein
MSGIVEARCAAAVVWSSPAGRPMHSRSSALEDVLAYDTTFLERYLLGQGIFASREEAQAAMVACKTFLWHAAQCPIIDVESDRVDAAWHAWLLHTEQYMRFCFECFGTYIHHVPMPATIQPVTAINARCGIALEEHTDDVHDHCRATCAR